MSSRSCPTWTSRWKVPPAAVLPERWVRRLVPRAPASLPVPLAPVSAPERRAQASVPERRRVSAPEPRPASVPERRRALVPAPRTALVPAPRTASVPAPRRPRCRSDDGPWCRSDDGPRRRCHHLGKLLGRRLLRAHLRLHDPLLRCRLAGSGLGAALHLARSLRRYPLAGRLARRGAPSPPRGRAARHLAGGRLPRARPLLRLRCLFPTGGPSHLEHSLVCAIYRFL